MIKIAVIAGLTIFIFALAAYKYYERDERVISARVQQYRSDKKPVQSKGFWQDISHSPVSTWAQKGADRFHDVLPKREWFDLQAQRAGLPITGGEFIVLIAGSSLVAAVVGFIFTFKITNALLVGILWLCFAVAYIQRKASKRMAAFDMQLGDALVMMSNALKAGFSFLQAMEVVVKEMGDPISTEFGRAIKETQLGMTLEAALDGIEHRIVNEDFSLVVTAVVIQRQVGGNLSQIIDTLCETIRERLKLKGEVRTLAAEGIMSGWVIGLLPVFLAAIFLFKNPAYFDGILAHPIGRIVIGAGVVSECIGGFIISKIVDIKI